MESDLTRDIIKKERHHKTRTSVLLSTGKVVGNKCYHGDVVVDCRHLTTLWSCSSQ